MLVATTGGLLTSALDLVLPRACAGCGRPGEAICGPCRRELAELALPDRGRVAPRPVPPGWPGCSGTVQYSGVAARLMKAYKDGDRRDLAAPLGRLLADAVRREVTSSPFVPRQHPVLLVPVPSSPAAVRQRGDRPMLTLVRQVRRGLGPAVTPAPVLTLARGTADQAGLDREARQANLRGAMRVGRAAGVQGRHCVLVDDVLTSGATLTEGRRALLAAGAADVALAVCMVTPRRSSHVGLPFRRPAD